MLYSEPTNRKFCSHLGRTTLAVAPRVNHTKWCPTPSVPPPKSPDLPHGSLWSLINHIKVLHQYANLLSEAASGQGVHAPLLCGSAEMCQTHPALAWFAALCASISGSDSESNNDDRGSNSMFSIPKKYEEYQKHLDIWRQANPGLYSHAEAAYHVHQGYLVEDRNMTRFLVSKLLAEAKEYEVDIAGNILRARPSSYEEFHSQFTNWRKAGLYHTLCLAARNMPKAEQWMPKSLLHESSDWQELLDEFNQSSFCSKHRVAGICEALADRSPALSNHICSLLDKVAILTRVKSNTQSPTASNLLDDYLHMLQLPIDESSPYAHGLAMWGKLRQIIEDAVPPSLMCPSLYPPSNRGAWGYRRLELQMESGRLCIRPTPLQWIEKEALGQKDPGEKLPDRLYDILTRMGEAATSPEVAHLMLSPTTMTDCLAGKKVDMQSLKHFADRNYVIQAMGQSKLAGETHFIESINKLVACLPVIGVSRFPEPVQFLAWRVDLPPRALIYNGDVTEVDLSKTPPYLLPKTSMQDKLQNRTLSGISILEAPGSDHMGQIEVMAGLTDSGLESNGLESNAEYSSPISTQTDSGLESNAEYSSPISTQTDSLHTALRACIAEEIIAPHPDFADHPLHKVAIKTGPGKTELHHTTTLAEAVGLFTGPPPFRISDVALHESEPWNENHIDDRYAERQTADNGIRFRDWATVYHNEHEIQRCRMASHAITCGEVFETHFPLSTPAGHQWVSVTSTIPAETRVLRHMGGNSSLEVLRRSVESRFMHDGKLLPVRCKDDKVDRTHMELYTDHKSGNVLLAYAPIAFDGSRKAIEFMSFRHCEI